MKRKKRSQRKKDRASDRKVLRQEGDPGPARGSYVRHQLSPRHRRQMREAERLEALGLVLQPATKRFWRRKHLSAGAGHAPL